MTTKERFLQLVSEDESNTLERAKVRKVNRAAIRRSQEIALAILERLEILGWSQKRLADEMEVSPQLVNKWVRGGENFTIETLVNLEKVLQTSLLTVISQARLQDPVQMFTIRTVYHFAHVQQWKQVSVNKFIKRTRQYNREESMAI